MQFLRYWFHANPGFAEYNELDMLAAMGLCGLLLLAALLISLWRRRTSNSLSRKLSSSWATAAFWFAIVGLLFVVARVEDIQYFAMRFMWVLWTALLLLFVFVQFRKWRMRHYEVLPTQAVHDPRDPYLPRQKKR